MKRQGNVSGQVMLTSAFILAFILLLIALMLNNVIYFNNISYVGFMEHSGKDDVSIKNIVTKQAIYAYNLTKGDQAAYDQYMADLVGSLNTVALTHGYQVSYQRVSDNAPWSPADTYQSTSSLLNIYSKDSDKAYAIDTYYMPATPPAPPGPGGSSQPSVVSISVNKSTVIANGHDMALVQVHVTDPTGTLPLAGITVNLRATRGSFYLANGGDGDTVVTDSMGNAVTYYFPSSAGADILNASAGVHPVRPGNLSADIPITVQMPGGTCIHTVTPGDATAWTDHHGNDYYVYVQVPVTVPPANPAYKFSYFTVTATLDGSASSNVLYLSPSDMGSFTVPGYVQGAAGTAYSTSIVMRFGWPIHSGSETDRAYRAVFSVAVSAYCDIDSASYSNNRIYTVTGS